MEPWLAVVVPDATSGGIHVWHSEAPTTEHDGDSQTTTPNLYVSLLHVLHDFDAGNGSLHPACRIHGVNDSLLNLRAIEASPIVQHSVCPGIKIWCGQHMLSTISDRAYKCTTHTHAQMNCDFWSDMACLSCLPFNYSKALK
jgi:hypothetical protein